jgi:uncharacterized protein
MIKLSSDPVIDDASSADSGHSSATNSVSDQPSPEPRETARSRDVIPVGERRRLDPQYVPFQRYGGLIATVVVSLALLATAATIWLTSQAPRWIELLLAPAWLAVTIGLSWISYAWPALEYRYTSYLLDERGIEIRAGVVWRVVLSVPRSRVQHIDVSQGPLERVFGLGRLVIYTAGTDHSRVELPGLAYDVAFALRNHLLPLGQDDAV